HYAGLSQGLRRGPVEEVALERFSRGRSVWVRSDAPSDFDLWEIVCRARSRLGENCYRLLTNNCEHFCEWCLRGHSRSSQVEQLIAAPVKVLFEMINPRQRVAWPHL